MDKKFYITTSIAYTNAAPHIGFALELLQADVLARYHRSLGEKTYFLTGTDEHGNSVAHAAEKQGIKPLEFSTLISKEYQKLAKVLNISNDDFIRTTDQKKHWPGVEKIWNILVTNGDLYKKKYQGLYCIGHEAFMKKSDLVDGHCPLHKTKPEEIEEENWFFKLTKYRKEIKSRIENDELKIVPEFRKKEILNLLDDAEDVSFSRPVKTLSWGIPVPNDPEQTMYVWADALTNYISALGYGRDEVLFNQFWPADIHLIGKDIVRFHTMFWPAILLAAKLELPKAVYIHGFITVDGQKMSKTIGNVVDPFKLIEKYGADPVRYYLLREIPSNEDGDFSEKKLVERYNGDLANNLGNLVSRVAKLIETKLDGELHFDNKYFDKKAVVKIEEVTEKSRQAINQFKLHEALATIWELSSFANVYLDEKKPWAADSSPENILETLATSLEIIKATAVLLEPFMPETSEKILKNLGRPNIESLFPRLK